MWGRRERDLTIPFRSLKKGVQRANPADSLTAYPVHFSVELGACAVTISTWVGRCLLPYSLHVHPAASSAGQIE